MIIGYIIVWFYNYCNVNGRLNEIIGYNVFVWCFNFLGLFGWNWYFYW